MEGVLFRRTQMLFNEFYYKEELMKTKACEPLQNSVVRDRELTHKTWVFQPICHRSPQILFEESFHRAYGVKLTDKYAYYEALGVNQKMCPNYDLFKQDLNNCSNFANKHADLTLNSYLTGFCRLVQNNSRFCLETNYRKRRQR